MYEFFEVLRLFYILSQIPIRFDNRSIKVTGKTLSVVGGVMYDLKVG